MLFILFCTYNTRVYDVFDEWDCMDLTENDANDDARPANHSHQRRDGALARGIMAVMAIIIVTKQQARTIMDTQAYSMRTKVYYFIITVARSDIISNFLTSP